MFIESKLITVDSVTSAWVKSISVEYLMSVNVIVCRYAQSSSVCVELCAVRVNDFSSIAVSCG